MSGAGEFEAGTALAQELANALLRLGSISPAALLPIRLQTWAQLGDPGKSRREAGF